MNTFQAGHLPGLDPNTLQWIDLGAREPACAGVMVPVLSPEQVRQVCRCVQQQAALHLRTMSLADIMRVIDQAVARLLDPTDPARQRLNDWLARVTGLSTDMVSLNLTRYLKTFRAQGLSRFVTEDLPNPWVLDRFQPLAKGGSGMALGPNLLLHLWAGNVPALSLWSLVCGLLVKAGNVGKLASAEPIFATVFVQVLIDIEPRWRDALALLWWEGGDTAPEAAACTDAACIIAYGSDDTLQALQAELHALNPQADQHRVVHGELDPGLLTGLGLHSARANEHTLVFLGELGTEQPSGSSDSQGKYLGSRPSRHDPAIRTLSLRFPQPFQWAGFSSAMELLTTLRGADLLRLKGIVNDMLFLARADQGATAARQAADLVPGQAQVSGSSARVSPVASSCWRKSSSVST